MQPSIYTILLDGARQRFRLSLSDGTTLDAHSLFGSLTPVDGPWPFDVRGQQLEIPAANIVGVVNIRDREATIKTIDAASRGGSDFWGYVTYDDAERLTGGDAVADVVLRLSTPHNFVEGAPAGTYKFLVLDGVSFAINAIRAQGPTHVALALTRVERA